MIRLLEANCPSIANDIASEVVGASKQRCKQRSISTRWDSMRRCRAEGGGLAVVVNDAERVVAAHYGGRRV